MKLPFLHSRSKRAAALLLPAFALGALLHLSGHFPIAGENSRFEAYMQDIFIEEVSSNSLNLHYTLAYPEKYGISAAASPLGEINSLDTDIDVVLENYENGIRQFAYEELSEENQITFDTMLLWFHTQREGTQYRLLEEVLSPSLGIQAQLPILLAEYTFYDEDDIEDYFSILRSVGDYFEGILEFEREKAAEGYFMSDANLEAILEQCEEFISNTESHYLIKIFPEKLDEAGVLHENKRKVYIEENETLVRNYVLPAYTLLINGLTELKGSGNNEMGLYYYSDGKDYYTWLLRSEIGDYRTPDAIRQRLYTQLAQDTAKLAELLQEEPTLAAEAFHNTYTIDSPKAALAELNTIYTEDFPELPDVEYEVKYVDESLEEYLSPAFYLTPPIDALSPNTIYINEADDSTDLELYVTLAHEGFPGHLYQTQYFAQTNSSDIRWIPSFGGYVEGWATYIESYACSYAQTDSALTQVLWLNRSINLCLCSIIDLGIHYYGWSESDVTHYLGNFGISGSSVVRNIYEAILADPSNYLKYYLGCLNFMDLRDEASNILGEDFDLKRFHQQILEAGPAQFPVLQKHLGLWTS